MMKLVRFMVLFIVLLVQSITAIDDIPDQTLLWNRFVEVLAFDRYVLALGERGITLLEWNSTVQELLEHSHVILPSPALTMKREGLVIVVRLVNGTLVFVNFERINDMAILGELKPSFDYSDFALYEDQLYLSRWFDGIDRYRVTNFGELTFIDNLRPGVLITQLHLETRFLYALDMYNGVIQYDVRTGFNENPKRLLLVERPFAMSVWSSFVFISMSSLGVVIGDFDGDSAAISEFIADIPSPETVLGAGNRLAFVSHREVNIRNRNTFEELANISLDSEKTGGSIALVESEFFLLLPKQSGGIASIGISNFDNKREVLHRPGPVNSVLIAQNQLFTGGGGNPLEMYEIIGDSLLPPELLRGETTGLTDLAQNGNLLFALYANEKKLLVFDITELNEMIEPIDSFLFTIDNAKQLQVNDSLILIIGKNQIEFLSGEFGQAVWDFDKPIVEAEIQNNVLYVTNRFGGIAAFTIKSDLSLLECAERDLTGTGWAMTFYGNQLQVFTGNTLTSFSGCLELDTIIRLPLFVLDAEIVRDTLYTIGLDGMAKYDMSSGLPVFIESGGLGGSQISVDDGVIATTDGGSVHLYFENPQVVSDENIIEAPAEVVLFDNFPEPFNSSTTMQFELPESSRVELAVYNLLGQKVRILADEVYSSGCHSIHWDGLDQNGTESASGVYFYRLRTNQAIVSKKMLLLK